MRTLRLILVVALVLLGHGIASAETCAWKERVTGGDDNIDLLIAPVALTVGAVACHCEGACTGPIATMALLDRAGNSISLSGTLTCSTGTGVSTWVSTNPADGDRDLVVGEGLEFSVTNVPASFDRVVLCVRFL